METIGDNYEDHSWKQIILSEFACAGDEVVTIDFLSLVLYFPLISHVRNSLWVGSRSHRTMIARAGSSRVHIAPSIVP